MKNNVIFLAAIFLLPLFSCNKNSESSLIETQTLLTVNIPIVGESLDITKSELNTFEKEYLFSGASSYSEISDNNSGHQINNIRNIKPTDNPVISFSGISSGDEFYSLMLEWGTINSDDANYEMNESIDLLALESKIEDGTLIVKMNSELINLITNLEGNHNNNTVLIKINGKSNFNINSIAKLEIPVLVESENLSPRFELF